MLVASLLSGIRAGKTAVELGEVVRDPGPISTGIEEHPAITEYQPLERDAERSLAKYTTTDTELYVFIEAESIPPGFRWLFKTAGTNSISRARTRFSTGFVIPLMPVTFRTSCNPSWKRPVQRIA